MIKFSLRITASFVLATSLIFPGYSFDDVRNKVLNVSYAASNQNIVSPKIVEAMVENFIIQKDYLSEWKEAKVQLKYELFDIDDSLLGYYFEVKEGNEVLGYFITSATFDREPILEYGEGNLSEFDIEINKGNKIYYLGGLHYSYAKNQVDLTQNLDEIKKSTLYKLEKEGEENTDIYQKIEKYKIKSIVKNVEHKKLWEKYLENSNQSLSFFSPNVAKAASSYKVLAVDDIEQDLPGIDNPGSACAPTVGAMIADYYHDVKGYSVRDNAYYGSWAELVNHLYDEMNTNWYGTSMSEWANGMYKHVIHDVSSSAWGYNYMGAVGNEYAYTQSIESDDPVALRFDRYKSTSSVYTEYHFITGIGFDKNGDFTGDLHVAIKDPDDNSSATKWIDWTVNDQDMEIGYMY